MTHGEAFEAPVERGRDLLVFRIGAARFATPLASVDEAVELAPGTIQALPGDNRALHGVFPLRGALVPLYVAHHVLGTSGAADAMALVVRPDGAPSRAAVAVDDVEDVLTVLDADVRGATAGAEGDAVVRGVVHRESSVIAIVDLNALVTACRAGDGRERQ